MKNLKVLFAFIIILFALSSPNSGQQEMLAISNDQNNCNIAYVNQKKKSFSQECQPRTGYVCLLRRELTILI
jgi:hypothetical protein